MNRTTVATLVGATLCASLTALGDSEARAQTADEARNEATFLAMVEAINDRDLDRLDGLVSPDVVRHSQSTPGVVVTNLEEFEAFLRADFAGVADSRQSCPLTVAEGDAIAVWCTYEGHQTGPTGPDPATGPRVALDFAGVLRFEDGKIARIDVVWDNLAVLAQLGRLPAPGGEPPGLSPVQAWDAPPPDPAMEERNRAAFRVFVEAQNQRDWDRLAEVVADDMVRHSQATPGREEMRGLEAFQTYLVQSTDEMPDWRVDCPTVLAENELIGAWCTFAGTQEGPMGPFPPSGKRMEIDFAGILRFEDGKIAEWWVAWDNVAALTQLGHFPPPGDPGEAETNEREETP